MKSERIFRTIKAPLPVGRGWGWVLACSILLSLSSCGLYNKYERPEVVTDDIVRDPLALNGALQATDTTSFGNLPWRQVFTDPQLQSLIEKGLANNPEGPEVCPSGIPALRLAECAGYHCHAEDRPLGDYQVVPGAPECLVERRPVR